MTAVFPTRHAEARMQQRGLSSADIQLVLSAGTQMDDEVFFLTNDDADREITELKRTISSLERLRGQKVVCSGESIITSYKSRRKDQKRMMRRRNGGL